MYPELFHIGWFTMNSFGLMMALAFISAGFIAHWQFKKRGVRPDFIYGLLIAAVIGGLLGAKIHYLILHPERMAGQPPQRRRARLVRRPVRRHHRRRHRHAVLSKQSLARVMDAGAIAVSVGLRGGPHGLLPPRRRLRGPDRTCPGAWPSPRDFRPTTVKVHPTQLYEIAASLVIFALLVWVISPRFKREGPLIFVYAILAGIERFLVEFVRTNEPVLLGLTQQQWIAIGMIIVGIVFTWYFATRGRLRPAIDPATGRAVVAPAKSRPARPPPTRKTAGQGRAATAATRKK